MTEETYYSKYFGTGEELDEALKKALETDVNARIAADKATAAEDAASSANNAKAAAQSALAGVQNAIQNIPAGDTPIVNDLTTGGTTMALSGEMGKVLGQRPNPNLLHNARWDKPEYIIDQRGGYVVPPDTQYYTDTGLTTPDKKTTKYYTVTYVDGVYGIISDGTQTRYVNWTEAIRGYADGNYWIDRWRGAYAVDTCLIEDGGIRFINGRAGSTYFRQYLDEFMPAGTYTLSILAVDAIEESGKTAYAYISSDSGTYLDSKTIRPGLTSHTVSLPGGRYNRVQIAMNQGANVKIAAIKLERGSVQTLAHQDEAGNWVLNEIPDKGLELLKCVSSTADSSDTYANGGFVNRAGDTVPGDTFSFNGGYAKLHSDRTFLQFSSYPAPNETAGGNHIQLFNEKLNDALMLVHRDENNARSEYAFLHTGNKPSGTYKGNGDATARPLDIGGIGEVVLIRNSTEGTLALVGYAGAILKTTDGVVAVSGDECNYRYGTLTITSIRAGLNSTGYTYAYQVL